MLLKEKVGYSYNDVTIVPNVISKVKSRSECDCFRDTNRLPIFASPMASVVSEENYKLFDERGITPILPRIKEYTIQHRIELIHKGWWVAVSLKEFKNEIINDLSLNSNKSNNEKIEYNICIDIANGHMQDLYDTCVKAKIEAFANNIKLNIMTGNIANADTYRWICKNARYQYTINGIPYNDCAVDYIRVGIGGGSGCITTSNVSIHYPQASLIDECDVARTEAYWDDYAEQCEVVCPKIVADGGIRNYDHVIKALALGADFVMIGSLFAQCIESAGMKTSRSTSQKVSLRFPIEHYERFSVNSKGYFKAYLTEEAIEKYVKPWKEVSIEEYDFDKYQEKLEELHQERNIGQLEVKFFGMASSDGQKSIDGEKKKTAEGITKFLPVKYTLDGWIENMISYLRSAMSYTNCFRLDEFIGGPALIINSISEIQAVNK